MEYFGIFFVFLLLRYFFKIKKILLILYLVFYKKYKKISSVLIYTNLNQTYTKRNQKFQKITQNAIKTYKKRNNLHKMQ